MRHETCYEHPAHMVSQTGIHPAVRPVLVIEDDAAVAQSIADIVREAGFNPVTVHTLADARPALERERPALVVLDLTLQSEFGGDLLEELSRQPDAPAVLIVSAFHLAKIVADLYHLPVVAKPFGVQQLITAVEQAFAANARPRRTGT